MEQRENRPEERQQVGDGVRTEQQRTLGGAEKEIDPLDDSEGKESGQDSKSYVVKGIIDDVVEQTFSFLVEGKHKLCQDLVGEALEAVVMGHSLLKK